MTVGGNRRCGRPTPTGPCRRPVTTPAAPCGANHTDPLSPTGAPPTGTPAIAAGADPFAGVDPTVSGVPELPSADVPAERVVDLTADQMSAVAVTDPARYEHALKLYVEADDDPDVQRLVVVAAGSPNPTLRLNAASHPACTAAAAEALLAGWWGEGTLARRDCADQASALFADNADVLDEAFVAQVAALPAFWRFALAHPSAPPEALTPATVTHIWGDRDLCVEITSRILSNPNCPPETITEAARLWGDDIYGRRTEAVEDWADETIPLAAVAHTACPPEALAVFVAHAASPRIAEAAAANPNWTAAAAAHAGLLSD